MANTLFLRLEGPLQAWGERSRWTVRDTAPEPTKSGVVGLLGCALGYSLDEDLRTLSQVIHMGVRCDKPGKMLTDFHTIIGGVLSAEGKIKNETVISWRAYICDASFLVAIQSTPEWIDRLASAVMQPVWPVFLGRKSCVPSKPIYEGVGEFSDLVQAIERWPIGNDQANEFRAVVEVPFGKGVIRQDEVNNNSYRTFLPRSVTEIMVHPPLNQEEQ